MYVWYDELKPQVCSPFWYCVAHEEAVIVFTIGICGLESIYNKEWQKQNDNLCITCRAGYPLKNQHQYQYQYFKVPVLDYQFLKWYRYQ